MFNNPPLLFLVLIFVLIVAYLFLRVKEEGATKNSNILPGISADDAYQEVQACLLKKDHRSAQSFALKYLEKDPTFHELRFLLVRSYIDTKKEYDAINHLLILIKEHSDDIKLYMQLGILYQNTRQYKKAISSYQDAIKRDNNNILAMQHLGNLYINDRQKDAALKVYKQLLNCFDDEKDKAEYYAILADLYASQGENQVSLDYYKKALKYQPTNIEIVKQSRKIYTRMKDIDNMLRLSKKLIAMAPANYDYYKDLIELLFNLQRYDEAMEFANKAMELDSRDEKSLMGIIAKIYTYTGKADEAVIIMKEKVEFDAANVEMVQTLAMAYCMDKDFPEGIKVCLDSIEVAMPSDVSKLQTIISNILGEHAVYLLEQDSTAEAFDKFNEAIQYNNENPEIYYKLCNANRKIKNYSESIKQCKRAIELKPEEGKYYVALGDLYTDLQNPIESKQQYKNAVDIDPRNVQAHTKLGILQAKDKEYENSIKSLQTALSLEEGNPDIRYNLALVYELEGELEQAKLEYKKVLAINPDHAEALNNLQILGE